jgi:hypothetical protein
MSFSRGIDGSDPIRPQPAAGLAGPQEERRSEQSSRLASGTLACPRCDGPVALGPRGASPADPLACPFCRHSATVRDFLSLTSPTRPARVEVRIVRRAREPTG